MRKLNEEEAARLKTKPPGRITKTRAELMLLEPGEYLQIEPRDWKARTYSPTYLCRRIEEKTSRKFSVQKVMDGGGWLVKREE